jgi:Zn-dependent peptidase ImmA (M78 family)/O-acetyl-ADP-ribose deacetylase (regulator of RNase III)
MASQKGKGQTAWTHPSVHALAAGGDPVGRIIEAAKALSLGAMESGWTGPPFDPFALADHLGIRIVPRDDIRDARLVPIAAEKLQIEYNPNRSKARIRFSIAHEIAHTLFADCRTQVRHRLARDQMRDDEWQLEMLCNIGAAEFLMPIGSFPELQDESLSIDDLLSLRDKYDVSFEAILLRLQKLTNLPCGIFAASRREREPNIGRYQIDYALLPEAWKIALSCGQLLPDDSVVSQCTAIGFTAKGDEQWIGETEPRHIECVGVSPYPEHSFPRVLGIVTMRKSRAGQRISIDYLRGDACQPRGSGNRIIAHVVNDKAARWGAGFARAVGTRWPVVQADFLEWSQAHRERFKLGNTHLSALEDTLAVFHMVAQHGYGPSPKARIRYSALADCLQQLATRAREWNASVHMPRIGCGQAGGRWEVVSELIDSALCRNGIKVYIYDLASGGKPRKSTDQQALFN